METLKNFVIGAAILFLVIGFTKKLGDELERNEDGTYKEYKCSK